MINKLPITPTVRRDALQAILDKVCDKYSIVSDVDKQSFVAQMAHESGMFRIKTENMNYTSPDRIQAIWPSRFGVGKLNPADYIKNPSKLANEVYANRMGNGDPSTGDGFRFRGGGFMQITGRDSYTKYAAYIGKTVEETAALVRSDDYWAMDAAAWLYCVEKKLLGETDFKVITKRINGGLIGYDDRLKIYESIA